MTEDTPRDNDEVEIRVRAKAQNAILARFADECGGCALAAKELGISEARFSRWLNFKSRLTVGRGSGSRLAEKQKLVVLLEKKTGRNIKEIFPLSKDEMNLLAKERVREHKVPRPRLAEIIYAQRTADRLAYNAEEEVKRSELSDSVEKVLKTLTFRERKILECRFGLDGQEPLTLEETGHVFRVNKERIRQLESKAIRKLQQPSRAGMLIKHIESE